MRRSVLNILTVGCILMVIGCSSETVYSHYKDITSSGWEQSDTMTFVIPQLESQGIYQPEVMFRITDNYHYQNINMLVETCCGDSRLRIDTLTLSIFDQHGKNKGDGLIHTEFSKQLKPVSLDTLEYTFKITSLMTENPLVGISCVGLRLQHK